MYSCQKSGHVRVLEAELDALAEDAIIGYLSRADNYSAFTEPADGPELAAVRGDLARLREARADLADAVTKRGKSPAWALEADDDYERQISALEERERKLLTPDKLRGLIGPGGDVAARWAGAPVSTRREVARLVLAPGRVGVMLLMPANRAGVRLPALQRVDWDRSR
jgi:site-specific DNA recombinase